MDAHYLQLEAEVKAEKENDRQRSNKKDIKYITNSEHRRVTYSRRSHSLVLAVCKNVLCKEHINKIHSI